jgi:hypothetical protein
LTPTGDRWVVISVYFVYKRSMEHEINDRAGIPIGLELKEL